MENISQKTILTRWDTVPEFIREAMASESNSKFLWDVSGKEHLSEDKITTVSRLAGYVFLGFVHARDLAQEIKDATGIDQRIASAIAEKLNAKLFAPISGELEKIYSPASADIKGSKETARPAATPAPVPFPPAEKKQTAVPPPQSGVAPAPIAGAAPKPEPAPVILHQESKIQPLQPKTPGFRIQVREPLPKTEIKRPVVPAPMPARIEIGVPPRPAAPEKPIEPVASISKVVHYSQFYTPPTTAEKPVPATPPMVKPLQPPTKPAPSPIAPVPKPSQTPTPKPIAPPPLKPENSKS